MLEVVAGAIVAAVLLVETDVTAGQGIAMDETARQVGDQFERRFGQQVFVVEACSGLKRQLRSEISDFQADL